MGAAYLSHFRNNLRRIEKQSPSFALSTAMHKLDFLREFETNMHKSKNITRDFMDVFVGIYNIGFIEAGKVIRSSQPSLADLSWLINEIRIHAVINLRAETGCWENFTMKDEEEFCHESLIEFINIPIEDWDEPPPSREQIEEVLKKIDFYAKPVLVHCAEGKGRTSLVSGSYQLSRLGWNWQDVLDEAVYYGFDPDLNPNQVEVMKSFEQVGGVS